LAKVEFNHGTHYKKTQEHFVAVEGMYVGQYIYCGSKARLATGNILPINKIPEGTTVCNVEKYTGDGGQFAKTSGTFVTVIGQTEDGRKTRIKLPSGHRKTIDGNSRAMLGIVAGGGRNEKPILKAGTKYWMFKPKRKMFPKVRGVCMNPVDHPHGGGNHQHVGKPTTISRTAPAGKKVNLFPTKHLGRFDCC
jgi:large subunit ribosomal protein L8e